MPFLNNDGLDDVPSYETIVSWAGGQVSFVRANQLTTNQASHIENCFVDLAGLLQKRRGTKNLVENFVAGENHRIQALLWRAATGVEQLIIFANGQAFQYASGAYSALFPAAISDVNENISAVQFIDDVYWTDSGKTGIRKWNGTTVTTVATSPIATILESFTNRLIAAGAVASPDSIHFSDLLDSSVWDVNNIIRVGADGDPIVAIRGWLETNLVVFKEHSTWSIDVTPTLIVADMPMASIHRTVGCLAKKSVCQVGQDLWFLSRTGIQSIQMQIATSNNVIAVPMSQNIHDVIQRINWTQAYKSVAIFYNNVYMLAVPLDDSDEPNAVIVYFYFTQSWAVWTGFQVTALLEQPIEGRTRLIVGNAAGEVREALDNLPENDDPESFLYLDGPGGLMLPFDLPAEFPQNHIRSRMVTRAMEFAEPCCPKSGFYVEAEFRGRYGEVIVNAILDGAAPVLLERFFLGPQQIFLPQNLPFNLPVSTWQRRRFPIHQLPPFREIQIEIISPQGNLVLRTLTLSAFPDTIELSRESPL